MSQDTRPATGPPPVSAGWTLADKYRDLLIRDGSTQGFNSLSGDVDGLLQPLLARLAAAEAERDGERIKRVASDNMLFNAGVTIGSLESERDAARAENVGLREELNKAAEDEASYSRRCSKVEAENARLREEIAACKRETDATRKAWQADSRLLDISFVKKMEKVLQQLADSDNANSDLEAKGAARRLLEAKPGVPGGTPAQ